MDFKEHILSRLNYFDICIIVIVSVVLIALLLTDDKPYVNVRIIGKRHWDAGGFFARYRFFFSSKNIIAEGLQKCDDVFQIFTPTGMRVLLPARFLPEVNKNPKLSFAAYLRRDFFATYPGFEAFNVHRGIFQDTVNKKLTPSMNTLTGPLARESARMIGNVMTPDDEWKVSNIVDDMTKIVSEVSSRVMLLDDSLGQVNRWHELSVQYGRAANTVIVQLKLIPAILRPVIYWILPSSYRLRRIVSDACAIVDTTLANNRPPDTEKQASVSTLQWMKETAERRGQVFNLAHGQLSMGVAAVLPMSNLVVNTLYDITATPGCLDPIIHEVEAALCEWGWDKKALSRMKLLDSAVKESLRLRSIQRIPIHRVAEEPVVLSDGTILPTGAVVGITNRAHTDPSTYRNPDMFDPFRFANLPNGEKSSNPKHALASTSTDHIGFGYGTQSCPGRWFAADTVKVILSRLLLQYEWKFIDGKRPYDMEIDNYAIPHPRGQIMYKLRNSHLQCA